MLTQEQFVVIELTEGSAINFIAVQILDYKEQGKCRAGLEDNAPFAITITAAMMCRLVLPVNVEKDEARKDHLHWELLMSDMHQQVASALFPLLVGWYVPLLHEEYLLCS